MQLISELIRHADRLAADRGLELHVEKSLSSASAYLRVRRGRYWFGLRISDHRPVYESSADFQQLLLPFDASDELTTKSLQQSVACFVEREGAVIADPGEVELAIQTAFVQHTGRRAGSLPSSYEISSVRHRLNRRAQWIYDIEQEQAAASSE